MSAADPTVAEMLIAVNTAIYAIVVKKFSSYSIAGRSYTYNDLGQLREMRAELSKESRTGNSMIRLAGLG